MRTLSTFQRGVEQPSPLSVFRPDDFSSRPQLTSPCDTVPRNDKSCSAGVIRAASWPSFCFVFLTGRQLRLISRSATLIPRHGTTTQSVRITTDGYHLTKLRRRCKVTGRAVPHD